LLAYFLQALCLKGQNSGCSPFPSSHTTERLAMKVDGARSKVAKRNGLYLVCFTVTWSSIPCRVFRLGPPALPIDPHCPIISDYRP
jgi:hypothetical protein